MAKESHLTPIHTTSNIDPLGERARGVPALQPQSPPVGHLLTNKLSQGKVAPPSPLPSPWDKPFVVVLVNWNCDEWLPELFESLVQQTADRSKWGVLVLDNNSDDDSLGKCRQWSVTHVCIPNNIGKLDGLNFISGILPQETVILEVDCDDTLKPNAIDVIMAAWNKAPDAIMIYTQYECVNEDLSYRSPGHCKQVGNTLDDAGWISHLKTYRAKALLDVGGVDGSVRKSTDKELIYRLQELATETGRHIVFLNEVVYSYRRRIEGSITRMKHWDASAARRMAYKRRSGLRNDAICVFSPTPPNDSGGPGIFWGRLFDGIGNREDFHVVDNIKNSDVVFGNVRIKGETDHQRPWVVRIDGIIMNTGIIGGRQVDYKERNKGLSDTIKVSEGVVYQSQWGKMMADQYCGECDSETAIISNAAVLPDGWKKAPRKKRKTIVTCGRWGDARYARKFKRLEATIDGFRYSGIANEGYKLIIIGQHYLDEAEWDIAGVEFIGRIPSIEVWKYFMEAACLMHLSWLDCCPNSVIEALAAKVPVLYCADGAAEIVGNAGVRLADSPLNHPCDVNQPPRLAPYEIAEGLRAVVEGEYSSDIFPDVSMNACIDKYAKFLKDIVDIGVNKLWDNGEDDVEK